MSTKQTKPLFAGKNKTIEIMRWQFMEMRVLTTNFLVVLSRWFWYINKAFLKNETRFWWNWVIFGGNSFFLNEIALFLGNCRSGRLSSSWNEHKRHYSNGKGCFKSLIWPNLVNLTHSNFFLSELFGSIRKKLNFSLKSSYFSQITA